MMDRLVTDDIPNIRFNVAKSYGVLIEVLKRLPAKGTVYDLDKSDSPPPPPSPKGEELIHKQILPNLEKLQSDSDVDVRFYSSKSLESISDDKMVTSP